VSKLEQIIIDMSNDVVQMDVKWDVRVSVLRFEAGPDSQTVVSRSPLTLLYDGTYTMGGEQETLYTGDLCRNTVNG
jgi:hypothetical protein